MPNNLNYATMFQTELDKQLIEGSTTGWMEPNSALVKYNGGSEVKVPSIVMDGLGDYSRTDGYVDGSVTLNYQTHTLTQDRGRAFSLDAMDVDETNFVATAGAVMGEFQRVHVIPEIDAYRYSKISSLAIAASRASGGYTATKSDILTRLLTDVAKVQDEIGESVPLVITLPYSVAMVMDTNSEVTKRLDVVEFVQGGVTLKVRALDGIPILRVPAARLKTEYLFRDGETTGQEAGGFEATANAKNINWMITARNAPLAISKTDVPRIFDPLTNQKANAWRIDYRKYHDLWINAQKLKGVYVNIKESLT